VVDGVNGLLVDPDDPLGLADAMCRVHTQLQGMGSMRVSARSAVENGFERKRCTEQLLAQWQSALSAKIR
jgi:glycosyltransferase involved in cell wall biosynthesis